MRKTSAAFLVLAITYATTICPASASTSVQKQIATDNKDFTIAGDTLTKYSGSDNIVTIPDGIKVIGKEAFYDNSNIEKVVLPDSVETIGSRAFALCGQLSNIQLSNNLQEIDDYSFDSCDALCDISLPDSVMEIGEKAFANCDTLSTIIIPGKVKNISTQSFFSCDSLSSVILKQGVQKISSKSFASCDNLLSVTLPDGLVQIGSNAFDNCKKLTSITIPDTVTTIDSNAFQYCVALNSVHLPTSLTNLGSYAFYSCTNLKDLTLPSHSTTNEYAFGSCDNLKYVTLESGITKISRYEFGGCYNLQSITIPKSVTSIDADAFADPANMLRQICCDNLTIRGYKNSTAELFASKHNIPFIPLDATEEELITLRDDTTGITVFAKTPILTVNTTLKVNQLETASSAFLNDIDKSSVSLDKDSALDYSLALYKDTDAFPLSGTVSVTVPLPTGFSSSKLVVLVIDSSGNIANLSGLKVTNGTISFQTATLYHLIIAQTSNSDSTVDIGDGTILPSSKIGKVLMQAINSVKNCREIHLPYAGWEKFSLGSAFIGKDIYLYLDDNGTITQIQNSLYTVDNYGDALVEVQSSGNYIVIPKSENPPTSDLVDTVEIAQGNTIPFYVHSGKTTDASFAVGNNKVSATRLFDEFANGTAYYGVYGSGKVSTETGVYVNGIKLFTVKNTKAPYISDTTMNISKVAGQTYWFCITPDSSTAKVGYLVGNGNVLSTRSKGKQSNGSYLFGFEVIGHWGDKTGVYVTINNQSYCVFNVFAN